MKLNGTITAMVTPFNRGVVDFKALKKLIQQQLLEEIDGILILGTTGESPTITDDERNQIIDFTVQEVNSKAQVLVGTGSNCTRKTIEYTKKAQNLGADMALIVTPYYNCPTQQGIIEHFQTIHSNCSLPLCVYNIGKRTGTNIETETLKQIITLPSVVAIKEASGNFNQVQDAISAAALLNKKVSILAGDDSATFPTILLGGNGVISVASNLIPKSIKCLTTLSLQGELKEARELHYQLLPLFRALFIETNPIPIKAAMAEWGLINNECRQPLSSINKEAHQKLSTILKFYKQMINKKTTFQYTCSNSN